FQGEKRGSRGRRSMRNRLSESGRHEICDFTHGLHRPSSGVRGFAFAVGPDLLTPALSPEYGGEGVKTASRTFAHTIDNHTQTRRDSSRPACESQSSCFSAARGGHFLRTPSPCRVFAA